MYKTRNTQENEKLLQAIQKGLIDLIKEIKKMSKDEIDIEKPNEIIDAVVEILDFNRENQKGQGLKILTLQKNNL